MKDLLFNSNHVLSRSRSPWVDYARGICIILVCYRHVFEGLSNVGVGSEHYGILGYFNNFFFSFRMPLFFIISGIFLSGSLVRKGVGDYVSDRFHNIFYPLLIWGTIQVTLQLLFAGYVNADRQPIDYLNLLTNPRKVEQFWYLNALFFVSVLYSLVKVYGKFKPIHQLLLGVFLYSLSEYFHFMQVNIGFLFDVMFFYLFFAIGDLIADLILNPRNYKVLTSIWTTVLLLPAFILMQDYFTHLNIAYQDDYYVQYQEPALFAITALIGGAFIINISFVLQKFRILKFLRVIGYHSLFIYVMHLMITAGTRIVMVRVFHIVNIPFLMVISIALGVLLPIVLYNLSCRFGFWWLFTLKKRKEFRNIFNPAIYFKRHIFLPSEKRS